MNKLLLVSMLVMLCISNINAARFLEDTKIEGTNATPVAETPEEIKTDVVEKKPEAVEVKTEEVEKPIEKNEQETTTPVNDTPKQETEIKDTKEEIKETKEEESKKETAVIDPVANEKTAEEKKETKEETKEEQKKEGEDQKEKEETPITPISEDAKKSSYFGLSLGFISLLVLGVLFFFVGFYRYSLRKYKIPPFTPPNFCPNFLFPRPENDLLMEDYCIQSGTELGGVYSSEKYHNFF